MAKLIFETTDIAESHTKLAECIAAGNARAECRVDQGRDKPYQVWDDQDERPPAPPTPQPEVAQEFTAAELKKLKALLRAAED